MEEKLLTTKEVADYFGVRKEHVTQCFCKRGLKYIKIGTKDYRYNKKDVLEFENKLKVTSDMLDATVYAVQHYCGKKKLEI